MGIQADYINFGNATSIERYLEKRCDKPLLYLKEKGILRLVAKDFANQRISTQFGNMPFHNKLVLILTDATSGLKIDSDLIERSIMPILSTYLKEYARDNRFEHSQNHVTLIPMRNENHVFYFTVLAVIAMALIVFIRIKEWNSPSETPVRIF